MIDKTFAEKFDIEWKKMKLVAELSIETFRDNYARVLDNKITDLELAEQCIKSAKIFAEVYSKQVEEYIEKLHEEYVKEKSE